MPRRPPMDPVAELDQSGIRVVTPHTPATIRDAQLVLAGRALDQPDPKAWLAEQLDILGIREPTDAA